MIAQRPPMGFNTWNCFGININEDLIKEIADKMVSSGLRDLGYEYLVLDDFWMAPERDSEGRMYADPQKFPSGIERLIEYVHSKG